MPAKLRNGVKGANGGARRGAGRKKAWATILKERVLADQNAEAGKSLDFVIKVRDNEKVDVGLRQAAAIEVMDRVWGKSKTVSEFSGLKGGPIMTGNAAIEKALEKLTPDQILAVALGHVQRAA